MIEQQTVVIDEGVLIRFSIQSDIEAIEKDASLFEEESFDKRVEAIDVIDFDIIDRIESLLQKTDQSGGLMLLKYRAEKIKTALAAVDFTLFKKLRESISGGKLSGNEFKTLIGEYVDFSLEAGAEPDYDNLDILINGLTSFLPLPEPVHELQPEMVYYQKTPARIIFELVERCNITSEDVFVDLGSGLGQVAMLLNLITGAKTIGVEYDTALYDYATACASELNLVNVTFINADAREAVYSQGSVFFMFTPFRGEIMERVLELLRKEALQRKIRVVTYGPCTAQVGLQGWLQRVLVGGIEDYRLAIFNV